MSQEIDIAALRKAAYRATPGPWEVQTGCSWRRIGTAHGHHRRDGDVLAPTVSAADGHPDISAPAGNLDYIAAANPAVILALLDRLEQAEKDAARYRWLRLQHWEKSTLCVVDNPREAVRLGYNCPSLERLDNAIDGDMEREGA